MKKKINSGKPLNIEKLRLKVLRLLEDNKGKSFNYRQVASRLGFTDEVIRGHIGKILLGLKQDKVLNEDRHGSFRINRVSSFAEGVIDINQKGDGYVAVDGYENDVYVPSTRIGNALPGDTVKIEMHAIRKGRRPEGEVIGIVSRSRSEFVGILEVSDKFAFLVPDNKAIQIDIFIPKDSLNGGKNGQKAIAKITSWPENSRNPAGTIVEILGTPGTNDTEMRSILAEFGFPNKFPDDVIEEAEKIPLGLTSEEIAQRKDYRDILTITIDPIDAKDFDDAISYRKLENGNTEVGVHIADVAYYVKPGTALDREAYSRATSVYLVDRVIPMLPEHLSNMVCSLRPDEEKACFAAIFELTPEAKVVNEWFGRTVIKSKRRYAYEEVQEIIEGAESPYSDVIHHLNALAFKLRKERFDSGAIKFETTEIRFQLGKESQELEVVAKVRKEAHMLIEDFMLLANRQVASFVANIDNGKLRPHFVYRVHDAPDPERIRQFADFADKFGYSVSVSSKSRIASSLNALLEKIEGTYEQNILEQMAIRSMAKAIYTTQNIGHYGLAFEFYTHFTSPIRRYPDVLVHRLLAEYLANPEPVKGYDLEKACKHSSEREKNATNAERASVKYKQIEMLQGKDGEVFEGTISGLKDFGFFVQIDYNLVEGMVRLSTISNDRYIFDEDDYCITGVRTGKVFKMGDRLHVRLLKTDLNARTVDFTYVQQNER